MLSEVEPGPYIEGCSAAGEDPRRERPQMTLRHAAGNGTALTTRLRGSREEEASML